MFEGLLTGVEFVYPIWALATVRAFAACVVFVLCSRYASSVAGYILIDVFIKEITLAHRLLLTLHTTSAHVLSFVSVSFGHRLRSPYRSVNLSMKTRMN